MRKSFDFAAVLKNHEKIVKKRPTQFHSVADGVKKRLETNLKNRKSNRLSVFDKIRNISNCDSPVKLPPPPNELQLKIEHRRQQLEKWKEEKEKRKKEAAAQKAKPFLVGVAHAPLSFVPPPPPPKAMPSTFGRVTRSQSARSNASKQKIQTKNSPENSKTLFSFAPKNAAFKPQINNLLKVPTLTLNYTRTKKNCKKNLVAFEPIVYNSDENITLHSDSKANSKSVSNDLPRTRNKLQPVARQVNRETRTVRNKVTKKGNPKAKSMQTKQTISSSSDSDKTVEASPVPRVSRKSLQRTHTPKQPVPKSESTSEEKLRSPRVSFEIMNTENAVDAIKSPEVPTTPVQTVEGIKEISPFVTMSRGKDNARREMKKKMDDGLLDEDASNIDSVVHFRQQLDSEVKRITAMCDEWDQLYETISLPESIQEQVLGAVGQARLLVAQKLQQFAALVARCERPDQGRAVVTPADLHGFWDMVFLQVENVNMRFKKLEEIKARDWVEDKPVQVKKKVVKQAAKKVVKAAGHSRLREMIAAARKAKQQEQKSPIPNPPSVDEKTFEAGFFSVTSPVRTPTFGTPAGKNNLLRSVLSSEARRVSTASLSKNTASYAMLRASVLSKDVEIEGVMPLQETPKATPINLKATPARSILKSAAKSTKKSGKKSIKTVLFNESDLDFQNDSITHMQIDQLFDKEGNKENELNTDSGLSSMDLEKDSEKIKNKASNKKKSKLIRQEAVEENLSPLKTRSRRRSEINTSSMKVDEDESKTPRRSARRKNTLQEQEKNVEEVEIKTPKRSSRRRKSEVNVLI